jgi:hypothetical protein
VSTTGPHEQSGEAAWQERFWLAGASDNPVAGLRVISGSRSQSFTVNPVRGLSFIR